MTLYLAWRYLMLPRSCILYSEQGSDSSITSSKIYVNNYLQWMAY